MPIARVRGQMRVSPKLFTSFRSKIVLAPVSTPNRVGTPFILISTSGRLLA